MRRLVVMMVAALATWSCGDGSAASATSPPEPAGSSTPSADPSHAGPPAVEPSWCVTQRLFDHHVAIGDIGGRVGDPRAGDPSWVYLEVMTDAIGLAGPVVPVDALDVTTARASQQWVTEAGEGSIAALSVGDALEYVILDDASGSPPMSLIPLESRICLTGDTLTSSFALAAGDTPGVHPSVMIEARIGGAIVGRTDPTTIEIGQSPCRLAAPDPLEDWVEPRDSLDVWIDPGLSGFLPAGGPAALDIAGLERAPGGPWIIRFAGDAERALADLDSVAVHLVFVDPYSSAVRIVLRRDRNDPVGTAEVEVSPPGRAGAVGDVGFEWDANRLAITISEVALPPGGGVIAAVIVEGPGDAPGAMDVTLPVPCGPGPALP